MRADRKRAFLDGVKIIYWRKRRRGSGGQQPPARPLCNPGAPPAPGVPAGSRTGRRSRARVKAPEGRTGGSESRSLFSYNFPHPPSPPARTRPPPPGPSRQWGGTSPRTLPWQNPGTQIWGHQNVQRPDHFIKGGAREGRGRPDPSAPWRLPALLHAPAPPPRLRPRPASSILEGSPQPRRPRGVPPASVSWRLPRASASSRGPTFRPPASSWGPPTPSPGVHAGFPLPWPGAQGACQARLSWWEQTHR